MWQESKTSPTYVYGFLSTAKVPKVLASLSEVIDLSRATCHASSVTNITMPKPVPLNQLKEEVEIRFKSPHIVAYKKAQLHLTIVYVDVPKGLTRSVASLHQGNETVIMDTPPGWPFGSGSKDHNNTVAIPEHGHQVSEPIKSESIGCETVGDKTHKPQTGKVGLLKDAVEETPTKPEVKVKDDIDSKNQGQTKPAVVEITPASTIGVVVPVATDKPSEAREKQQSVSEAKGQISSAKQVDASPANEPLTPLEGAEKVENSGDKKSDASDNGKNPKDESENSTTPKDAAVTVPPSESAKDESDAKKTEKPEEQHKHNHLVNMLLHVLPMLRSLFE